MTKVWLFRSLLGLAVLLTCLLMTEWALRQHPKLLPRSYLDAVPFRRALRFEMNRAGILARTPLAGVPIPYQKVNSELRVPVPSDIVRSGLISKDQIPAREREQELRLVTDRHGLLNAHDPAAVDVVFIGDSYTYLGGVVEPPGLLVQLARATGLSILNLGVPSVGPTREAWLLDELGLVRDPRAVVWFFFGGNDLDDEEAYLKLRQQAGESTTYGELLGEAAQPKVVVLDVLEHFVSSAAAGAASVDPAHAKVPGFRLQADPEGREFWLLPERIRSLAKPRREWSAHPGWQPTQSVLRDVASRLRQRGIGFLLVYVPAKAQVTLPHVVVDEPLLLRMANHGSPPPLSLPPEKLWREALQNRGSLEALVRELCREREIAFLSLTPVLSEQASAGTLGYWSADSHWNSVGQSAAVPPLAEWLRSALPAANASADTQE